MVYHLLLTIPPGKVTTYKAIAEALGDKIAARAVATILSENRDPTIPCYKVVMSDGSIGGYAFGGSKEKLKKLKEDGVPIRGGKVNLKRAFFNDFQVKPILKYMQRAQEEIARRNKSLDFDFEGVIGVDVSYKECYGYGAAVLMEDGMMEYKVWKGRVRFPYIPTYLAFREAPFMYKAAKPFKGLLLVDGQGITHPRKAGEAVHIGMMLSLPSLGVAKKPLLPSQKPYRGVYVSKGYGLPPEELVDRFWMDGKRQPKVLELAHKIATQHMREDTL